MCHHHKARPCNVKTNARCSLGPGFPFRWWTRAESRGGEKELNPINWTSEEFLTLHTECTWGQRAKCQRGLHPRPGKQALFKQDRNVGFEQGRRNLSSAINTAMNRTQENTARSFLCVVLCTYGTVCMYGINVCIYGMTVWMYRTYMCVQYLYICMHVCIHVCMYHRVIHIHVCVCGMYVRMVCMYVLYECTICSLYMYTCTINEPYVYMCACMYSCTLYLIFRYVLIESTPCMHICMHVCGISLCVFAACMNVCRYVRYVCIEV